MNRRLFLDRFEKGILTSCGVLLAWRGLASAAIANLAASSAKELYGKESRTHLGLVRQPLTDLRWHFCTTAILDDRKARNVCLFDLYGHPLRKANANAKTGEVPLAVDDTVRQVLDKAGFEGWKRGQPQLRLVGCNWILQSPLTPPARGSGEEDLRQFLQMPVRPGDILVVALVD